MVSDLGAPLSFSYRLLEDLRFCHCNNVRLHNTFLDSSHNTCRIAGNTPHQSAEAFLVVVAAHGRNTCHDVAAGGSVEAARD